MILHYKGDLLKANTWDAFCHVANSQHCFGAGIAAQIRKELPMMYEADCATPYNDDSKLGTVSYAKLPDGRIGFNIYAMSHIGSDGTPKNRSLNYDDLYDGLLKVIDHMYNGTYGNSNIDIGIPKYIGCGLAGGSWHIVNAMLEDLSNRYKRVVFHVYEFEG